MAIFWVGVFTVSLALLVKSAGWFVKGAEKIGLALGMSPFIIGATIVAVGTSLPELVSSLMAVFQGASELVAANVVGSNIGNILLILGLSAVLANGLALERKSTHAEIFLLCASTVLIVAAISDYVITVFDGGALAFFYAAYVIYKVCLEEERPGEDVRAGSRNNSTSVVLRDLGYVAVGIVGLYIGASYTIEAITELSGLLGVPKTLIAITVLAVGTSLPELVVSVKTALQKKVDISAGNIIGSNIFNALAVSGIPALISPLRVDSITVTIGIPFLILATALLVASWFYQMISRWHGFGYVLLFFLFLATLTRSLL